MQKLIRILVLYILLFAVPVLSHAEDRVAVGVLDLVSETVSAPETRILTDRLRSELVRTGRFSVIERERMNALLAEQGFQQNTCVAAECVVEVGQLIGVQKMIAGNIGRIGTVYTLSVRVIDVGTGTIEQTAVKDCQCPLQDVLTQVIAEAAREIAYGSSGASVGSSVVTDPAAPGGGSTSSSQSSSTGPGVIYVTSTPQNADVYVDGILYGKKTPAVVDSIGSGPHVLRLVKESFVAVDTIRVVSGQLVRAELTLQPSSGSIHITSTPSEAAVIIDDRPAGSTPVSLPGLPPGDHDIRVIQPHYFPFDTVISGGAESVTLLQADLRPVGYLAMHIMPPPAEITIDGERVAGSSNTAIPLAVGEHSIAARRARFDPLVDTVTIRHGETTEFTREFVSSFGQVQISSTPEGAAISSMPGGITGTTPLMLSRLEPGDYLISVSAPNYVPREEQIFVESGRTTTMHIDLPFAPLEEEARRMRMERVAAVVLLGAAVVTGTVGYIYDRDAATAYRDRKEAHRQYREAETTNDAIYWRYIADIGETRGDMYATRRNIFYGLAGTLGAVSVTLMVW